MNDNEYYNACAISAMQSLIQKVPLGDSDKGDDVNTIRDEIVKSADYYAAAMVRIRQERIGKQ